MNRILFPQARDVLAVTSMVADAALQRAPADTVRQFLDNPVSKFSLTTRRRG